VLRGDAVPQNFRIYGGSEVMAEQGRFFGRAQPFPALDLLDHGQGAVDDVLMPGAAVFWPIRDLAVEDDFLRPRVVGIVERRRRKKGGSQPERDASPLVSILRPLLFDVTLAETDRVKGDQLPDPLPVGILRALAAEPAR